ncbi:MAG TPA: translocation/assembly module TamB domain-containing protein, partial [bacterium]|nr:translocation/assembly module TamB domain-containing protein [bacterium]
LPEQRLVIEETGDTADDDDDIGGDTGLPLDFSIVAHDGIRVQNPHMNLSLAARLQVTGTTRLPGVLGTVTFNRGTIDLLLHEFEITGGTVNFTRPYELNPGIDITATTEVKDERITLRITGTADAPNLLLSSETGKSHAEIMNMLLGRDALGDDRDLADLAADYARQAAAIAAAEAISTRTDLIVIPFPESLEGEDLLFGVGRKFGDRWTVMYYVGEKSDEGDAVEVEFEVSPKSDIRLRQNQDGTFSGGFRYRETFN